MSKRPGLFNGPGKEISAEDLKRGDIILTNHNEKLTRCVFIQRLQVSKDVEIGVRLIKFNSEVAKDYISKAEIAVNLSQQKGGKIPKEEQFILLIGRARVKSSVRVHIFQNRMEKFPGESDIVTEADKLYCLEKVINKETAVLRQMTRDCQYNPFGRIIYILRNNVCRYVKGQILRSYSYELM